MSLDFGDSGGRYAMPSDAQTIIRLNIQHYEALLRSELDDGKRATVTRLLNEERQKLEALRQRSPLPDGEDSL